MHRQHLRARATRVRRRACSLPQYSTLNAACLEARGAHGAVQALYRHARRGSTRVCLKPPKGQPHLLGHLPPPRAGSQRPRARALRGDMPKLRQGTGCGRPGAAAGGSGRGDEGGRAGARLRGVPLVVQRRALGGGGPGRLARRRRRVQEAGAGAGLVEAAVVDPVRGLRVVRVGALLRARARARGSGRQAGADAHVQ